MQYTKDNPPKIGRRVYMPCVTITDPAEMWIIVTYHNERMPQLKRGLIFSTPQEAAALAVEVVYESDIAPAPSFDTTNTECPVCPYCGEMSPEPEIYHCAGFKLEKCDSCGKDYEVHRDISVSYSTFKKGH